MTWLSGESAPHIYDKTLSAEMNFKLRGAFNADGGLLTAVYLPESPI